MTKNELLEQMYAAQDVLAMCPTFSIDSNRLMGYIVAITKDIAKLDEVK